MNPPAKLVVSVYTKKKAMKKYIFYGMFALMGLFTAACSTSQETAGTDKERYRSGDTIIVQQPLTLADFLERVPGVYMEGNDVSIRGQGTPLFIVDGVWVGNSYASAASAVSVNDIASVEVLKSPAETAIYGRRGANGVIIIHTKGADPKAGKYQ